MIKDIANGLNIKNPDMDSLREENKGFYFIKKYKFQFHFLNLRLNLM